MERAVVMLGKAKQSKTTHTKKNDRYVTQHTGSFNSPSPLFHLSFASGLERVCVGYGLATLGWVNWMLWAGMDWLACLGLVWIGLAWLGLHDWTMDWIGLVWFGLDCRLNCGLHCAGRLEGGGLGRTELNWMGLEWNVSSGRIGLVHGIN